MSVLASLRQLWTRQQAASQIKARRSLGRLRSAEALEQRTLLSGSATLPRGFLSFDPATGNIHKTVVDSAASNFRQNQTLLATLPGTTSTGAARQWSYVQVEDFNGDGFEDVAAFDMVDRQWWVAASQFDQLIVSSTPWATLTTSWTATASYLDVVSADFNGDGTADIGMRASDNRWVLLTSTGTNFDVEQERVAWDLERTWTDVLTGDFNGDGAQDILGRTIGSNQWWVITHRFETGFDGIARPVWDSRLWGTFTEAWMNNTTWVDTIVGDFNGDGFDDVITRSQQGGGLWGMVSAASQGGQFVDRPTTFGFQPAQYAGALWRLGDWRDVKVGDFNGDGLDDMLARNAISNQWTVTFGTTALISATVNKPRLLGQHVGAEFWNAGWQNLTNFVDVIVADFNNDGRDDVSARSQQGGGVFVMLADGSGKVFAAEQWWGAWNRNIAWAGTDFACFDRPNTGGPTLQSSATDVTIDLRDVRMGFGDTVLINLTALDPDLPEDTMTFLLGFGGPAGLQMFTGSTTALLFWQADLTTAVGTFLFSVTLSDQRGLQDTVTFTIRVIDSDNPPPLVGPVDLGQLGSGATALGSGSLVPFGSGPIEDSQDIYSFTLAADSLLTITANPNLINTSMRLYQDVNNNGVTELGELLEITVGFGSLSFFPDVALTAGITYVLVMESADDQPINYTLNVTVSSVVDDGFNPVAGIIDLGTFTGFSPTISDVIQAGQTDLYRFTLSTGVNSAMTITPSAWYEGITARLFRDANSNGVLESGELVSTTGKASGTFGFVPFSPALTLPAGDYFVEVTVPASVDNTEYTLRFSGIF